MFSWLCPECESNHFYTGNLTTRATTNCPKSKHKYKVFQYKVVVEEPKNKMLEIAIERLKPPRAPTMVETSVAEKGSNPSSYEADTTGVAEYIPTDSKTIEVDPFVWLSSNHSFQMVIQEFMRKFAPGLKEFGIKTRGNKKVLKDSFSMARRDLMKELTQVLEARKK